MSWLFSRALVEEYSPASRQDEESLPPLSVMPTPHKFWRSDKTMDHSRLSQFGLTCAVLTESRGEELLTAYLEGSRAKTSASQEMEMDLMERSPPCGTKWNGSLARFDPNALNWRTAQCSLLGGLGEFLQDFPRWGTTVDGELYPLPPPALHTSESGYGSFPTPVASMYKGSSVNSLTRKDGRDRTRDRLDHFIFAQTGGQLNPEWVEWLMGWPIGWTDLKPLEMGRFPNV